MSYILTGIQHLKTGDVIIPAASYENVDDYKKVYHHEMDYAISNKDFLGLGIRVFDSETLYDVLTDNWVRGTKKVNPVEEVMQ